MTNKEIASHTSDPEYRKLVAQRLTDYMEHYATDKNVQQKWDYYQKELDCCGVFEYKDWYPIFGNDSLPKTCCMYDFFRPCDKTFVKTPVGCRDKLLHFYAVSLDGVASFVRSLLDPTAAFQ